MDWLDHLSARDVDLLRTVASRAGVALGGGIDGEALSRLLAHPATFDAVFADDTAEPLLPASPFLTFALVVHRGWADLQHATYVEEWVGPANGYRCSAATTCASSSPPTDGACS